MRVVLPKVAVESTSRSTNFRENFAIRSKSRNTNFPENLLFRKFLNRQISVKIQGFVRNFRTIWNFCYNYMIYSINSGFKYRVSDRGAHFFDRRPVLCNNIFIFIYLYIKPFIYLFIYTFIYLFIFTFIHLFIFTFIHLYIYTFLHIYKYTFIHVYIYTYS